MSGFDVTQRSVGQGGTRILDPHQQMAVRDATVKLVQEILAGRNIDVTFTKGMSNETGRTTERRRMPDDAPDLEESLMELKEIASNLEKIILLLQLESQDKQKEVHEQRLDSAKGASEARHGEMKAKIKDNINAMEKAARQQLLQKILGWVAVGIAVAMAIVTAGAFIAAAGAAAGAAAAGTAAATGATATATTGAATGATTGVTTGVVAGTTGAAATGTAAAGSVTLGQMICSVVSAVLTATNQTLNETGVMDKLTEKLSASIKNSFGCTQEKADMWAQIIIGVGTIAATLPTSLYGGQGFANAFKLGAKMKYAMLGLQIGMSLGGLAQQGVAISAQYKSGMTGAALTETKAMIQLVEQIMEEIQQELQEILDQMQNLIAKMYEIINSKMDTEAEIARRIGSMDA